MNRLRLGLIAQLSGTKIFPRLGRPRRQIFCALQVRRCAVVASDAARPFPALTDTDKAAMGATSITKGKSS